MLKSVSDWLGANTATSENDQSQANKEGEAVDSAVPKTEKKNICSNETSNGALNEDPTEIESKSEERRASLTDDREKTETASQDDTALLALENATSVAFDSAKQVGSILYSFGRAAGSVMAEQASKLKTVVQEKRLLSSFSEDQEGFATCQKVLKKIEEDSVPPWVGYNEEKTMKEQILNLSTDSQHFLKDPPSDAKYEFDFALTYPVALATLREDANLRNMRFKLVPKRISEEKFWRNYFYRVTLIKQSAQLKTLEQQQEGAEQKKEKKKKEEEDKEEEKKEEKKEEEDKEEEKKKKEEEDKEEEKKEEKKKEEEDKEEEKKEEEKKEEKKEEEKKEEEEEEILDEDWEQVLQQELEEFVKMEGGGGTHSTAEGLQGLAGDDDDDDPEDLDLLVQQMEEEILQA